MGKYSGYLAVGAYFSPPNSSVSIVAKLNKLELMILPVHFVEFGQKLKFPLFSILLAELKMADYPVGNFQNGRANF